MKKSSRKFIGWMLGISMLCGTLPMAVLAASEPTTLWIEGESGTANNSNNVYKYSSNRDTRDVSAGNVMRFKANTLTGGDTTYGYYADYSVVLAPGTYDIYFRCVDDAFALTDAGTTSYMSDAHLYINGAEKAYTNILNEGWVNSTFVGNKFAEDYAYGWVKASDVSDPTTIRWAYSEFRTEGNNYLYGGLDCIVIVPSGTQFTPVKTNIVNTKIDYDISLLLSSYDLSNVTEKLTLPETLADGTAVTWSSSNTAVIANDGTVKSPADSAADVTLTATVGEYSKDFAVTVPVFSELPEEPEDPEEPEVSGPTATDGRYIKLEETDATKVVGFDQRPKYSHWSGGSALVLGTETAPDANGYYIEFEIDIEETSDYKIWVYGGHPNSDYASNTTMILDGTTELTLVREGDLEWGTDYGANMRICYNNTTTTLTAGTHTLKYLITKKANSGSYYLGTLDFMMLVPEGYTWTPSITELPIPPVGEPDEFEVTDFAISGNVAAGETITATAKIKRNVGATGECNLILAIYDVEHELIDVDICTLEVGNTAVDFNCSVSLEADDTDAAYAKAFVWTGFNELRPILQAIDTLQ